MIKKLIRTNSTGISGQNKNSKKNLSQTKNHSAVVVKAKPKKIFRQIVQKENILIEEPPQIKYSKAQPGLKKRTSQKPNKRSKSLICEKRIAQKIDTTHNSSRVVQQIENLSKGEESSKEDIDFPINITSVRGAAHYYHQDMSPFADYSPLYVRQKKDFSTQARQILIEDAEVQCQQFAFEDARKIKVQREQEQHEKKDLMFKIKDLEARMEQGIRAMSLRQVKIYASHQGQIKKLNRSILGLKEENLVLSKEKESLKEVINSQQKEIIIYRQTQSSLEVHLKSEEEMRLNLVKVNEESMKEIEFYKKELLSFEDNLSGLQKMKKVYENRLDELQNQKIRIKHHASDLLQMVQKYKQIQDASDM